MTTQRIIPGDCIEGMATLPDSSVNCCVTSPPYWGLRDYGHAGQIGLEDSPEEYVSRMVEVFREVRRVLRDDGTAWVNLGDSYNGSGGIGGAGKQHTSEGCVTRPDNRSGWSGLKQKDLVGIPWRVAFALQSDGWFLRQDLIWHKPNPMPESVRDRCTKAHEYVFLLAKSERYFYDADAVSEAAACPEGPGNKRHKYTEACADGDERMRTKAGLLEIGPRETRNRRSVWTITTKPYSGAHFAVMPPDLVEPCILAGCPEGGTVLDPFAGSGTTLAVAAKLGRNAIGCELNETYIALANKRIKDARECVSLFDSIEAAAGVAVSKDGGGE